ncbi:LpxD N-terminal domain-containing protein [Chloroflexota bacterium]
MLGNRIGVAELRDSILEACVVLGDMDRYISNVAQIDQASTDSVSFYSGKGDSAISNIRSSNAGVIICSNELQLIEADYRDKTLILVPRPRLAFIKVMQEYFAQKVNFGISATATIDEAAILHPNVYVGPNSYVGKCEIGKNTVIHGNVYIYPGTIIGGNVIIHAGAVIGAEGQGFERNEKEELEKFPQIGGVVIEDDVEIGSNASIMRGAMGNTVIGQGTKIGHLCSIGHGVVIGQHCLIITHSMIAGSCRIGDYSQVSLGACIRNGVKIGKNVVVGMGAVVTEGVDDGKTVFGVSAKERVQ